MAQSPISSRRAAAPGGRGVRSAKEELGASAVFAMAVGGMIGGGIFSVLGVVVSVAGTWAWGSFVLGGVLTLVTALSYAEMADRRGPGGLPTYLDAAGHRRTAGWVLLLLLSGYVLTLAVYAFTFGHYLAEVLSLDTLTARVASVTVVAVLAGVNVRGVRSAARLEISAVWGKLAILVGLAGIGLWRWDPRHLGGGGGSGASGLIVGAGSVFMAYEGFQLLAYDQDDITSPQRALRRTVPAAVVSVTVIYVVVALGAASLIGGRALVAHEEVALAEAGRSALGGAGLWAVTVAAVLSTASAINATLFAAARLSLRGASVGHLPSVFAARRDDGVPVAAVLALAVPAGVFAAIGGLEPLVAAASLTFLLTFASVNWLASRGRAHRARALVGACGTSAMAVVLTVHLVSTQPVTLAAFAAAAVIAAAVAIWRATIVTSSSTAQS